MVREALRLAWRYARRHPLQTTLTLLQVAVGTWAVASILSALFLLNARVENSPAADVLTVRAVVERRDESGRLLYGRLLPLFGPQDVAVLAKESPNIASAATATHVDYSLAQAGGEWYRIQDVQGATHTYPEVASLKMVAGTPFTAHDVETGSCVLLLSDQATEILFPKGGALGAKVSLSRFSRSGEPQRGTQFTVIGIYKHPDVFERVDWNTPHYIIPMGAYGVGADRQAINLGSFQILVRARPGRASEAVEDAKAILQRLHGDDVPVQVRTRGPAQTALSSLEGPLLMLAVLAFAALVVSSVGILGIMLVAVVERARQIALSRALGASRPAVVVQILLEAVALSICGGIAGLAAAALSGPSLISAFTAEWVASWSSVGVALDPRAGFIALAVTAATGGLLGLYPAVQAALVPPVEGLREGLG